MTENQKLREVLRFTKKPVTIEATQWFKHGDHAAVTSIPADHPIDRNCIDPSVFGWVPTLEGGHVVTPGDWIITGVKGEHYPCKPDIFAATYVPADEQALALPTADHIPDAGEMVADHLPDAGKMTNGLTQAETDASASVSGLTAAPLVEREAFENEMRHVDVWGHRSLKKRASGNYENWQVNLMWDAWQARAALSTGDAVDARQTPEPHAVITGKLGTHCSFNSSELRKGDPIYTAAQIDAAMRKGQL